MSTQITISGVGGTFKLEGTNYLSVLADGTPEENGAAVRAAYTAAQAMTPNGAAISATNRITILLAPGYYSFNEGVDGTFAINTSYIDFVSLSGSRDVYFSSIQVKSMLATPLDIYISGIDTTKNSYFFHGAFVIASEGDSNENIIVKNCKGGDYSFSSFSSGFLGLYENCEAGSYSFCSTGDAVSPPSGIISSSTGNFLNLGNIINCKASYYSFVSGVDVPAGTIANYGDIKGCEALNFSFCYSEFKAQNLGLIEDCKSYDYSFCAVFDYVNTGQSTNNGRIINCTVYGNGICIYGGASPLATSAYNLGTISNCQAFSAGTAISSIVINGGIPAGTNAGSILNCYVDGNGFCGPDGQNFGNIIECTAVDTSFCSDYPLGNGGQILRCTLLDWAFVVGATSGGRVVLGIDTTGVVNF